MNQSQEKPLNVEAAAEFLDISKSHLYKLTSQGVIPHYQPGGKRIYFMPSDLLDYVRSGKKKTADEIEREAINAIA